MLEVQKGGFCAGALVIGAVRRPRASLGAHIRAAKVIGQLQMPLEIAQLALSLLGVWMNRVDVAAKDGNADSPSVQACLDGGGKVAVNDAWRIIEDLLDCKLDA